jgi:hypothetical protein
VSVGQQVQVALSSDIVGIFLYVIHSLHFNPSYFHRVSSMIEHEI